MTVMPLQRDAPGGRLQLWPPEGARAASVWPRTTTMALAKRSVMLLVGVDQARVHRAGAAGLLNGAAGAESHVLCIGTLWCILQRRDTSRSVAGTADLSRLCLASVLLAGPLCRLLGDAPVS